MFFYKVQDYFAWITVNRLPLIANAFNITMVLTISTLKLTHEHLLQLKDFHIFVYGAENYPKQTI